MMDEEVDELASPVQESAARAIQGMASSSNSIGTQPASQQPSPVDNHSPLPSSSTGGPICANCSTQTTSLWRRSPEGQTLCNACSLYQKMKGTPRPVSLKTDTIKHRNRSKGDKKLKDGQSGKVKSKKASGAVGGRGSSVGPAAGSNRVQDTKMEGVVEEEFDEDLAGNETDELATENGSIVNGDLSSSQNRPRASLDGNSPLSAAASLATQHPGITDILRAQAKSKEMAAAMALTGAKKQPSGSHSSHSNNMRRSSSADGRSAQQHQYPSMQPIYNPHNPITSLYNSVLAARQASSLQGNPDSRLANPRGPSGSASANSSPYMSPSYLAAQQSILSNPLFFPRMSLGHPSTNNAKEQPAVTQSNPAQTRHTYRDWPPTGVTSRTGSKSTTPTDTPQKSPLFDGNLQQQQQRSTSGANGRNSPLSSTTANNTPPPAQVPTSRFAPAAFQLSSLYPRSASTDRFGPGRNGKNGTDGQRQAEPTEEEREAQKIRLDQLFAAAGQRLSETASQSATTRSPTPSQMAQSSLHPTAAASGRTNTSHHSNASYKPYELHHPRSSSRMGHHASDTRYPSVLNTAKTSPQQAVLKNGRPGSSASSSDDSNDAKKGFTSITSPAYQGYASPGLPPIPDNNDMAIDGQAGERYQANVSPPFGLPAHLANAVAPGAIVSDSERRGRSTTRRMRDGEVGDAVAHELGALRMRDSSQNSAYARSRSPAAYLPQPHLANRVVGATITPPDLDDGIVRDAMTHRPVSDLRASGSASTLQTLPSLSEALSSSGSSRSISNGRSHSRQPISSALKPASIASNPSPPILPPPNSGFEEVSRLRTRIQELEFINGLMEGRVAELEAARNQQLPLPHGPNCGCRCADSAAETETWQAAEYLKNELASHGIQGIGEKQSRDLLDLLVHRLGYRAGDLK